MEGGSWPREAPSWRVWCSLPSGQACPSTSVPLSTKDAEARGAREMGVTFALCYFAELLSCSNILGCDCW